MTTTMPRVGPAYDPKIAAHVLWHFRQRGGQEPGDFTRHLLKTIASADSGNTTRLRFGFAAYVDTFHLAANTPSGIEVLAAIATADYSPVGG